MDLRIEVKHTTGDVAEVHLILEFMMPFHLLLRPDRALQIIRRGLEILREAEQEQSSRLEHLR